MNYTSILANFTITELNEMQKASLDAITKPNDVILVAPTGSGKTLGFLLPMLPFLDANNTQVQVLILVPTRELAIQIEKVFKQMGTQFKINCCYGGHSVGIEENNLKQPPAVLVGTPGRIAHHLRRKNLELNQTHTLILDEFDKSLEFGFKDEMEYIIVKCSNLKKRILTSATELKEIPGFVGLTNSELLNYTTEHEQLQSALVLKTVKVDGDDKIEALLKLLGKIGNKPVLVFCNHREVVERISDQLKLYKIEHGFYHGGLEQIEREKALIKLRNGSTHILITTDLASRGLDIPEIESIVHYQMPPTEEVMIHRNGRTARMNAAGTAYFLLDINDYLPRFLTVTPEFEKLPTELKIPNPCQWKTLYIGAGKKDKINKIDIVGMLIQKGQLKKEEIGKIEVLDHMAYVAVKATKITKTLQLIRDEKIKNRRYKIALST